ncbi:MAG TPA: sensor domain-containing diguanylate cyclase [Acidimicrobiales bacterium]|nr:sensor domain-containing diguanylate cyclase [Acidimicrobiales bacterium]
MRTTDQSELVPLTERLTGIQAVRTVSAAAVVLTVLTMGERLGDPWIGLVPLVVGHLAATWVLELVRRRSGRRALATVSWLLLADGIVLAVAVTTTGGPTSPLVGLVYLHLVAVTLLTSYRTALRVAAWHALLLVGAHVAPSAPAEGDAVPIAVLVAVSYLVLAGATAALAAVNEGALRRGRQDLAALVELSTELEASLAPDDLATTAVGHLRHRLGRPAAAVIVRDHRRWSGVVDGGRGPVGLESEAAVDAVVIRAASERAPVLVRELSPDDDPFLHRLLPGALNVVVAPLIADGQHLGSAVVVCGPSARTGLSQASLASLSQTASMVALTLRNSRLVAELEALAGRDPLTGLANRRAFDDALEAEVARARRAGTPLSLVMMDLDRFKEVNDVHGHQVGDEVLRQLGVALATAARTGDVVARYGGEEFVILCPGCDSDQSLAVADRLRRAAEQVTALPVTASAGVATMPPHATDGSALVAAADLALYQAKDAGRDRAVRLAVGSLTVTPAVHNG